MWKSRAVIFDREGNKRATCRSLIRAKEKPMTHLLVLSFCHLIVQVTWWKSNDRRDGDVARSRELVDGGQLTQEIIRSTAENVRKRNVHIS